ncbi:carboxylesterase family protein [Rosenbergiella australiborealis]|uniref:Carboxylic ester hydrolase n=1 Tax=Rosenbergiella australiborealis TaxID=1544696 RepID=A0ABS5T624_9GAMM|nr:carboxylesterase family protein [Rosenbergiella australiborealis]
MHTYQKVGLCLLLGTSLSSTAWGSGKVDSPVVPISTGDVQGTEQDGVVAFLGIPYAKPPIGSLRWRAPQPLTAWTGVKKVDSFASDCMQKPFEGDAAPMGTQPSEDCLYLNVWKPAAKSDQKRPVMVWIYGGGYVNGGSSTAIYNGESFAKSGVVMVSFNYRVGRFGFFAHPALTAEAGKDEPLGNYGYMDQIAALKWVKENIHQFGGDDNNITVFGESAGGASVLDLMASPAAQGLFNKAIVMSGGGRGSLLPMRDLSSSHNGLASAETVGIDFAKSMGITDTGAQGLEKLRALPASKIVDGLNMGSMAGSNTYVGGPIRDGKIVINPASQRFAEGKQAKIPLIIGATNADLGFPTTKNKDEIFNSFGAEKEKARAIFDPNGHLSGQELAATIARERMMIEPARNIARLVSATNIPVYAYRFSYVAETMRKEWPGAPHASELPYMFKTLPARFGNNVTQSDFATSNALHDYWVDFAKTGHPTASNLAEWPVYSPTSDKLLDFGDHHIQVVQDPIKAQLDLIAETSSVKE